jgi:hypothetical protein
MTRLTEPQVPAPPEGPFRYGWRYVPRELKDGTTKHERVPLTLYDVLHPEIGDHIVNDTVHQSNVIHLRDVLTHRLASDPHGLVLCDTGVEWDVPGLEHHSPDVTVILGVRDPRAFRSMFDVATEGVRPALIVEVVSPNVRNNDVVDKVAEYHLARVPLYVIVDRQRREGPTHLLGYRYTPARYEPLAPDAQGRLWLEPVRLWLGLVANRVALYDSPEGPELGDYSAVCRQLETEAEARRQAEARAEAEAAARLQAERHAQAEAARAEAEAARAEAEAARAETEARARLQAELRAQAEAAQARAALDQAAAEARARAQAEAARQAAEAAEAALQARLRQMEEELRRLRDQAGK